MGYQAAFVCEQHLEICTNEMSWVVQPFLLRTWLMLLGRWELSVT